ncbi:unnamed protein product [Orchesella dallaii]|uniref:Elongation of very long chain fatty acids protein n=1 Tax=Orchesella dallaii TaxID=48710 RepID=A0ABP1RA58_9HEXA
MISSTFTRDEELHPEIKEWWFMSSFKTPMIICVIYIGCLLVIDRIIVKGRHLYDYISLSFEVIRFFVYISAVLNWGLLIFFIIMSIRLDYNYFCEPASKSLVSQTNVLWRWVSGDDSGEHTKKMELRAAKGMWLFFVTKIVDFMDHCALVFRNDEVRLDQVIHHIFMVAISWFGLRYAPGGSSIIWIILNCAFLSVAFTWQILAYYSPGSGTVERERFRQQSKPWVNLIKNLQFFLAGLHCVTITHIKCAYPSENAFFMLGFVSLVVFLNIAYTDGFGSGGTGGGGGAGGGGGSGGGRNPTRRGLNASDDDDNDDNSSGPKTGEPNNAISPSPAATTAVDPINPQSGGGEAGSKSCDSQGAQKSGDEASANSYSFNFMSLRGQQQQPFSHRLDVYPKVNYLTSRDNLVRRTFW